MRPKKSNKHAVSARMRRIRKADTKPELLVRSLVHSMGFRYRLHRRGLPGTPDLVFPSRRKVIFVHGCFWHGHENCPRGRLPRSRAKYWKRKIEANKLRDRRVEEKLASLGWRQLMIWDCRLRTQKAATASLPNALDEILEICSKRDRDYGVPLRK